MVDAMSCGKEVTSAAFEVHLKDVLHGCLVDLTMQQWPEVAIGDEIVASRGRFGTRQDTRYS